MGVQDELSVNGLEELCKSVPGIPSVNSDLPIRKRLQLRSPPTPLQTPLNDLVSEPEHSTLYNLVVQHYKQITYNAVVNNNSLAPNFLGKTENDSQKSFSSTKDLKLHWDLNIPLDEWELPAADGNIASPRNSVENNSETVLELLKCNPHNESPKQVINEPKHLDESHYPGQSLKKTMNTFSKLTVLARDNLCTSGFQLDQTFSMENDKPEDHDAVVRGPAVLGQNLFENVCCKSDEEYTKLYDVPGNGSSMSKFSTPADNTVFIHASSDKGKVSPPDTTLDDCQSVIVYPKKKNDKNAPLEFSPLLLNSDMKKFVPMSYGELDPPLEADLLKSSSDVALENPLDDGDASGIYLAHHDTLACHGKVTKQLTACVSAAKDGELGERVVLSSEDNESETEFVDYDIDGRDAYNETVNDCMTEAGSESIQNDGTADSLEKGKCGTFVSLKESSNSASMENNPMQNQVSMAVEANNSKRDEIVVSDSILQLEAKESVVEEMRSRTAGKKLSSRSGAFGAMQQHISASCFKDGKNFRSDKHLGRDRQASLLQDGRHKTNRSGPPSSYLKCRNHAQNNYRHGGGLLRRRNTAPESDGNDERLAYRDQRRSYSGKGVYQSTFWRRPLDKRDSTCGTQRENIESRDDSYCMIKGRSEGNHPRRFEAPRTENQDPRSESYGWMAARRQHTTSPVRNINQRFSHPYKWSRLRSRTRSPIPRDAQEERYKGTKMGKTRTHYEGSMFGNNDSLLSPPRKRLSAQGSLGYFNYQDGGSSRILGRNSPSRFIGQHQGFDSKASVEKEKSNDGFGPRVDPQRFPMPSGEASKECHYDKKDNEKTNCRDRNDMIRRVRNCENGGDQRRFHMDSRDCINLRNARNNNGREGRGPFKKLQGQNVIPTTDKKENKEGRKRERDTF